MSRRGARRLSKYPNRPPSNDYMETEYEDIVIVGGGRSQAKTLREHIELLEEIEQYRKIGTVEEIKRWMEELTKLRMCTVVGSGEYPYWHGYNEGKEIGYNKAIDEFRVKVNKEIHMCFSDDLEIQKHIDEIAKQMKEGDSDA